jgi:hypothetical protein
MSIVKRPNLRLIRPQSRGKTQRKHKNKAKLNGKGRRSPGFAIPNNKEGNINKIKQAVS